MPSFRTSAVSTPARRKVKPSARRFDFEGRASAEVELIAKSFGDHHPTRAIDGNNHAITVSPMVIPINGRSQRQSAPLAGRLASGRPPSRRRAGSKSTALAARAPRLVLSRGESTTMFRTRVTARPCGRDSVAPTVAAAWHDQPAQANSAPTLSPVWIRRMASAINGATESTLSLPSRFSRETWTVLVTVNDSIGDAAK